MKIYNYGNPEKNSLFLLPGSCAHPENYFGGIREYLEKFYNVFRVGYTGFNKTENTDFVSVTDEAEKIENYVKDNLDGKIHGILACGEGAKIAALLLDRGNIKIEKCVLDGREMEYADGFFGKVAMKNKIKSTYKLLHEGQLPRNLKNYLLDDKSGYYKKYTGLMGYESHKNMSFVTEKSVENFITSAMTEKPKEKIISDRDISIIYYTKMGEVLKQRYEKFFPTANIMAFEYDDEELLCMYPKPMSIVLRRCTGDL